LYVFVTITIVISRRKLVANYSVFSRKKEIRKLLMLVLLMLALAITMAQGEGRAHTWDFILRREAS